MLPTAHPFSRRRFIASASAAAGALALPATLRSQATPKLYTIRSVWLGRYVDAHEVESLDWQMVVRTRQAPPADQTQHWQLIPVGDGYFEIRQSSSQRYADAHDGDDDDWRMVTRERQNNTSQHWFLESVGTDTWRIFNRAWERFVDVHDGDDDDWRMVLRERQPNTAQAPNTSQFWEIKEVSVDAEPPPPPPPKPSTPDPTANMVPAAYLGTWTGTGTQVNPSVEWPMRITIRGGAVGSIVGGAEYPEQSCGGNLILEEVASGIVLGESLTYGQGSCTDGGTITLTLRGDGRLAFGWVGIRTDGSVSTATGMLSRA